MDELISIDKIFHLPEEILEVSKNNVYQTLFPTDEIHNCNFGKIRKAIIQKIEKFSAESFYYNMPVETLVNISPSYEFKEGFIPRGVSKPTENVALRIVMAQKYVNNFYYTMLKISQIINPSEAIYLVEGLFGKKSEEKIAESLNISPTSLRKIKKSCLFKMWLEFAKLDDE